LSWNVHGLPLHSNTPERLRRIAVEINGQQPDLVLLQEVWLGRYKRFLARALEPDYQLVYDPRWVTGWPRGGLVMFIRLVSGWLISGSAFRCYNSSAPWYRVTEFDGLGGKGILMAKIASGSSSLIVVDTHLQSQYVGRDYLCERRAQIEELSLFFRTEYPNTPVLVGGDFNTDAGEALYASHLSKLGSDLTVKERQGCQCGTKFGSHGTRQEWTDYILASNWNVNPTIRRIENDFADTPYSDHDGLLARLLYDGTSLRGA
jgi:endonuclease/exonuclease/phosphatase family metal-dependent hydrolase